MSFQGLYCKNCPLFDANGATIVKLQSGNSSQGYPNSSENGRSQFSGEFLRCVGSSQRNQQLEIIYSMHGGYSVGLVRANVLLILYMHDTFWDVPHYTVHKIAMLECTKFLSRQWWRRTIGGGSRNFPTPKSFGSCHRCPHRNFAQFFLQCM